MEKGNPSSFFITAVFTSDANDLFPEDCAYRQKKMISLLHQDMEYWISREKLDCLSKENLPDSKFVIGMYSK